MGTTYTRTSRKCSLKTGQITFFNFPRREVGNSQILCVGWSFVRLWVVCTPFGYWGRPGDSPPGHPRDNFSRRECPHATRPARLPNSPPAVALTLSPGAISGRETETGRGRSQILWHLPHGRPGPKGWIWRSRCSRLLCVGSAPLPGLDGLIQVMWFRMAFKCFIKRPYYCLYCLKSKQTDTSRHKNGTLNCIRVKMRNQ